MEKLSSLQNIDELEKWSQRLHSDVVDLLKDVCELSREPSRCETDHIAEQESGSPYHEALRHLNETRQRITKHPYCLPLYLLSASQYFLLDYPDLAAGAAYKALLLSDAIKDEGDEFHEQAVDAVQAVVSQFFQNEGGCKQESPRDKDEDTSNYNIVFEHVSNIYLPLVYESLINCLVLCDCLQTAYTYCSQACKQYPDHARLREASLQIRKTIAPRLQINMVEVEIGPSGSWPDSGFVRRELYPWNDVEPDRIKQLPTLNTMMSAVAPKLEVLAVELPNLTESRSDNDSSTVQQLGVFAKEDILPGEVVLDESSLLTANNKLQDALCDACSRDLPDLDSDEAGTTVSCPECEVVFCSQHCYDEAASSYHPALCGMDVEGIAKDVPPAQAADALYSLLLLRALAMSETQQCHPLELKEVKYIWGDFHDSSVEDDWESRRPGSSKGHLPRTLPFSFEQNIRLPFHMLEKMDIDIFANPQYDVWVFNTLYAKFRGTASARLSGLGGRAMRGPEVSAVHPMWCLANHSCDPNVSWEWGGSVKFWTREQRAQWKDKEGVACGHSKVGIKKGEEILNHYCDIELPVKERREWARGALGGDCRCERCIFEAGERR